jgi:hypothetical protein
MQRIIVAAGLLAIRFKSSEKLGEVTPTRGGSVSSAAPQQD